MVNQRNGACYFDRQNFEFSALCSVHFNPDCFPFRQRFEIEQMGRKPNKVVLKIMKMQYPQFIHQC